MKNSILILLTITITPCLTLAQDIIFSPKYADLPTVTDGNFSATKNIIEIEFADAATALANKDKLKLTMSPADLTNVAASVIVKSEPIEASRDNFLRYNIKTQLTGLSTAEIGFFLQGANTLYSKKIKLKKMDNNAAIAAPASPPTHYFPVPPLTNFSIPNINMPAKIGEANFDANAFEEYNKSNSTKKFVYVFSGDQNNSIYIDKGKSRKIKVGQPISIVLNPVPNPLRYTVKILSYYSILNTDTDSLLEKVFLNPWTLLGKNFAFSNDPSALSRKQEVLGYLQQVNSRLKEYMDSYRQIDGIDPNKFKDNKKIVFDAVNTYLSSDANLHYPGNLTDFILNEFDPADSTYIKPILKNYQAFQDFNVSPIMYQIPSLPDVDQLNIKLQIIPRTKITTALQTDTSNHIDIPLFGGFKIDVSPGLFYSFYHQNIYTLSTDSTATITGGTTTYSKYKSITTEKQPGGNFGFSTLIHFYSRWGKDFNIAVSLGAGLTLEDNPQVRYLTGLSLLIGRVNRIAISGGYSFGRVTEISDHYSQATQLPLSVTSLDTYKVLKGDFFLSLSYNIPFLRRKSK